MGKKGRPLASQIRQNVLEILAQVNSGYGYQICKIYNEVFPKVTQRSVYYHLKKGVQIGEIKVQQIKLEQGNYSWGDKAEKIYYSLGEKAAPKGHEGLKSFLEKNKPANNPN